MRACVWAKMVLCDFGAVLGDLGLELELGLGLGLGLPRVRSGYRAYTNTDTPTHMCVRDVRA